MNSVALTLAVNSLVLFWDGCLFPHLFLVFVYFCSFLVPDLVPNN